MVRYNPAEHFGTFNLVRAALECDPEFRFDVAMHVFKSCPQSERIRLAKIALDPDLPNVRPANDNIPYIAVKSLVFEDEAGGPLTDDMKEVLSIALDSPDTDVREAATEVMGWIGGDWCIKTLEKVAQSDPSVDVRQCASEELEVLKESE